MPLLRCGRIPVDAVDGDLFLNYDILENPWSSRFYLAVLS